MAFHFDAFAFVSVLITLAAGTLQVDGEYENGGPGGLFLSAILVVQVSHGNFDFPDANYTADTITQFEGVVTSAKDGNPTGTPYLVNLHWFLNGFGWEYPSEATARNGLRSVESRWSGCYLLGDGMCAVEEMGQGQKAVDGRVKFRS